MTPVVSVSSLTEWITAARRDADRYAATDPTYAELMATYAALGELLESPEDGPEYVEDCRALLGRAVALGQQIGARTAQTMAVAVARARLDGRAA